MKLKLPIKNKQSGFTLLESLMALFVLTVGILGVAGLQVQSMKAGHFAKQRMIAVSYTEELLERIRSNPAGVAEYATVTAESFGCSSGNVCTATQMAADDLFIWNDAVTKAFPGEPNMTVTAEAIDDAALDPENLGRSININISWEDQGDSFSFDSVALINIQRQ